MSLRKPEPIAPGKYDGITILPAYNPLIKSLKPMDFFCVRGEGLVSSGIRLVEKNLSPDRKADYNHAGILPDGLGCSLEALWTLTSTNIFEHYEGCPILIARWNRMNSDVAIKTLKETNKHIGQLYPVRRIALHFFNIAHIFHWSSSLVCSEYVAKNLYKAGARHGEYYGTTPDTLADEIERELNHSRTGPKYSIIYKGTLPYNMYHFCSKCNFFWLFPESENFICPQCGTRFTPLLSKNKSLNAEIDRYNTEKRIYIKKLQA